MIFSQQGYQLGFFKVSSMLFWVINLVVLVSSLKKPLHNLFVLLFPLSTLAVVVSLFSEGPVTPYGAVSVQIVSHIFLSFLAYSLLTIATFQALLLAYQNHQLRHKHPMGMTRLLPPLQTMETLLFELLWVGVVLLTLSIITGFLFFEDLFAQHLVPQDGLLAAGLGHLRYSAMGPAPEWLARQPGGQMDTGGLCSADVGLFWHQISA